MPLFSNKHKYSIQRAIQVILSPIYSLISIFIKKNDRIVLTSLLNNEFSDNARALFEELYKLEPYRDRVYFVLNDEALRKKYNEVYPSRFISNQSFRDVCFILRARYWVCAAMELPAPTFFQRFQRTVYHLGHGMLYKKVGLLESNVSWYKKVYYFLVTSNFSYTLSTSDFFTDVISKAFGVSEERVLVMPQPKTGQIALPAELMPAAFADDSVTHVLYAPTWRPYNDVVLFPFKDLDVSELDRFLTQNNIHIWLRIHPRYEQNIDENLLALSNVRLFSSRDYDEINKYLGYFDALMSDYSSIFFDFLTLERPVLFVDYDLEEYRQKVGLIDHFEDVKCANSTTTMAQFFEQLTNVKNGEFDLHRVKTSNALVNFDLPNRDIPEHVIYRLFESR